MTTKSCSNELRERIVAAREKGHSATEISKWFRVSKRSVERYWNAYVKSGSIVPKQRGGYRRSRLEGHEGTLKKWMEDQPGLTLREMEAKCLNELGIEIKQTALWHRVQRLDFSFKKNDTCQRAGPY
jgi:transposase